jgi:hypothetical protein
MRGAGALGKADAWLTAADIPDAIRTAADGRSTRPNNQIILAQVGLSLTVEADDSVSACSGTFGRSELAPRLCALVIARGHFQHALSVEGAPVRGTASVTVQYSIDGPGTEPSLPPSPMMPQTWPLLYYRAGIAMTQPVQWPKAKNKEAAILLDFGDEKPPYCRTLKSSGDTALDKATCAAAASGAYDRQQSYGQLPMIVHWTGKKAEVQLPVSSRSTGATPVSGKPFLVRGVARADVHNPEAAAYVEVDDAGQGTACTIRDSAGTDAADIALCGQLTAARFNPPRDVFGRPFAGTAYVPVRFE